MSSSRRRPCGSAAVWSPDRSSSERTWQRASTRSWRCPGLRTIEEAPIDLMGRQAPTAGLRTALNEVRRLGSNVRDRLSTDTWRILSLLQQDMPPRHGHIQFEEVLVHLNRLVTDLAAFS